MIWGEHRGEVDDDGVLAAYPWPDEGPWVRAMMVTTLDGAPAGPDGLSGSISGDADRAVFRAVRRHADAVLVGAGTIRAEGYGAMRAQEADAEARERNGQRPAPRLAMVSPSLDLPWDTEVFTGSDEVPLVLTVAEPPAEALARAREARAEVLTAPGDDVQPGWVLDQLVGRALRRVVCEGGPQLLEAMVRAGLVDEADITLSPVFAGHEHVSSSDGLAEVARFELRHVLSADGFLMNRYVKA
ncbi:dihydrofolate reductase family protein [Nocardioides litoris]|uniref:dihydrofolate reductase family protein n=1 Tax=Nocardioides litoris TaxID=1926648 RepID=UPI001FE31208|nr:dihydrofolate reductase family protein [Nocardioides litoris]